MKKRYENKFRPFLSIALALLLTTAAVAQTSTKQDKKDIKEATKISGQAVEVFSGIMDDADKAIPSALLDKAEAVAIFPGVVKAAFIIGGRGGLGLISRRTATGWTAPAFYKMGGASFGAQIGATKTDYIMLIMNDGGLRSLMKDEFEIGGEVGVAAGPFGRTASASTDATLDAGILAYSHSKGLFAGAALKGGTISADNDRNRAVYGQTAKDVLGRDSTAVNAPAYVSGVPRMLTRYSPRKGGSVNFATGEK